MLVRPANNKLKTLLKTLETESKCRRKFRTQIPQKSITHKHIQTTNRFRTANKKERKTKHFQLQVKGELHKKRYSPHLLYNKVKLTIHRHTHTLFKLHEKQSDRTECEECEVKQNKRKITD